MVVACMCVDVRAKIQACVRQTFGLTPTFHKESSPCQTPKNPRLEMKQRRVCVGLHMCALFMCVPESCTSLAFLHPILTFPTGAGVNKAVAHSRCGEQSREQGRSKPLQP